MQISFFKEAKPLFSTWEIDYNNRNGNKKIANQKIREKDAVIKETKHIKSIYVILFKWRKVIFFLLNLRCE